MIKSIDGGIYRPSGNLNAFDPENIEDRALFNEIDAEIILRNGISIFYYEMMISSDVVDPTYNEARGAVFSTEPIELYAYYDPITSQNYQNMFGYDSINMTTFELNYNAVVEAIGHMPLVGSRIFTPHRKENWVIVQRGAADWKIWGQIRMIIECQQYQESLTRKEVQTPNPLPYKIN